MVILSTYGIYGSVLLDFAFFFHLPTNLVVYRLSKRILIWTRHFASKYELVCLQVIVRLYGALTIFRPTTSHKLTFDFVASTTSTSIGTMHQKSLAHSMKWKWWLPRRTDKSEWIQSWKTWWGYVPNVTWHWHVTYYICTHGNWHCHWHRNIHSFHKPKPRICYLTQFLRTSNLENRRKFKKTNECNE